MALFERKSQATAATVTPMEAECDRKLEELRRKREEYVMNIGLTFLAGNTPASVADTPYEEFVNGVISVDQEAEFLEKRKLALKGMRKCEKCGNILVLDSSFCNKCGEKLEPLFLEENKEQNVCSKCGATYAEGAAFCTSCGNKLS